MPMTIIGLVYFLLFLYSQNKANTGAFKDSTQDFTVFIVNSENSENISLTTGNAYFSIFQLKIIFKKTKFLALATFFSYFLEALVIIGFADRISIKIEEYGQTNFFQRDVYEFIQFFYYFGIIIGKSCICFIKTEKL